jgi:hypothetical protein
MAKRRQSTFTVSQQRELIVALFAEIDDPGELVGLIEHAGIELGPDVMSAADDIARHYQAGKGYDWRRACRDVRTFPPLAPN